MIASIIYTRQSVASGDRHLWGSPETGYRLGMGKVIEVTLIGKAKNEAARSDQEKGQQYQVV